MAPTDPRTRIRLVSSREYAAAPRRSPQRELGQQPGEGERDPAGVVEIVVVARAVDRVQGVRDPALRQCVAGMVHNTGGIVRRESEHA